MWKPIKVISSIIILFSLFSIIYTSNGERSPKCPPLQDRNHIPVIGILSHPSHTNGSYIRASYVKFAEAGGARVIPLLYDESWDDLFSKLELVNGVILTGGTRQNGLYFDVVKKIFEKVKEKNDAGEHFPLYAINLGFELLLKIVSENHNILESVEAQRFTTTLECEDVDIHGTVMGSYPLWLRNKLMKDCLVSLNNKYGISRERFFKDKQLPSFFKAITTCNDRNNKVFITTVQAYEYPIVGFQWNPQKNAYDWSSPEIPKSLYAIQVTQYAANYLVSEVRKSNIVPPAEIVLNNLIYNYNTYFSSSLNGGGDETYYFDAHKSSTSTKALAEE